jgi:hypothetical protein
VLFTLFPLSFLHAKFLHSAHNPVHWMIKPVAPKFDWVGFEGPSTPRAAQTEFFIAIPKGDVYN